MPAAPDVHVLHRAATNSALSPRASNSTISSPYVLSDEASEGDFSAHPPAPPSQILSEREGLLALANNHDERDRRLMYRLAPRKNHVSAHESLGLPTPLVERSGASKVARTRLALGPQVDQGHRALARGVNIGPQRESWSAALMRTPRRGCPPQPRTHLEGVARLRAPFRKGNPAR
jgi:hypothetical protein